MVRGRGLEGNYAETLLSILLPLRAPRSCLQRIATMGTIVAGVIKESVSQMLVIVVVNFIYHTLLSRCSLDTTRRTYHKSFSHLDSKPFLRLNLELSLLRSQRVTYSSYHRLNCGHCSS